MSKRYACNFAAALIALLVSSAAVVTAAESGAPEYAIKATYLYKFGPFVRWPDSAFASAASPFNICLAGSDPFGAQLDNAVRGEQIGTHPIAVQRLAAAAPTGCHVLYIAGSADVIAEMLKQVKGQPVLTVTESDREPGRAGIINFVIEGNRVRFQVDNKSAAENDLVLSSKLLSLASLVIPKATEKGE